MNVNYLANFIFVENIDNIKITLFLDELENPKNLFFFLLDLFFKGIVILYGGENIIDKNDGKIYKKSVELNNLSEEQIGIIQDKLKLAYIKLNLEYYHYSLYENGSKDNLDKYKFSNINELKNINDNLNLKEYIFKLSIGEYIYNINFDLFYDI